MHADLRYSLRSLWGRPGYTVPVVLILTLAIAGNSAIFSVVDSVLLRPLPYRDPDSLVLMWGSDRFDVRRGLTRIVHEALAGHDDLFEMTAPFLGGSGAPIRENLGVEGAGSVNVVFAGDRLFDVLGVTPLLGSVAHSDGGTVRGDPVVVLSHALWQKVYAGSPEVIGQEVRIGAGKYQIAAVAPKEFFFPEKDIQVWVLFSEDYRGPAAGFDSWWLAGRLQPGVTPEAANGEVGRTVERLRAAGSKSAGRTAAAFPIDRAVLHDFRSIILVLWGLLSLILLQAIVNVTTLLMCRTLERREEIAVRIALGAGRGRLLRQLLGEDLVLGLIAGGAGLLLGRAIVAGLVAFGAGEIPRLADVAFDFRVAAFTMGIACVSAFGFGLLPALLVSRVNPVDELKSGGTTSRGAGNENLRQLLTTAVVSVTLVLVAGAALLMHSFLKLTSLDWGYDPENAYLVIIWLPEEMTDYPRVVRLSDEVLDQVRQIPGVAKATSGDGLPFWYHRDAVYPSLDGATMALGDDIWREEWLVGPEYFTTLGIRILEGRDFRREDRGVPGGRVAVSRRIAERLWPGEPAVGKRLYFLHIREELWQDYKEGRVRRWDLPYYDPAAYESRSPVPAEVVAVVDEVQMIGHKSNPPPKLYSVDPHSRWKFHRPSIKLAVRLSGDARGTLKAVRERVISIEPGVTIQEESLEALIAGDIGGKGTSKLSFMVAFFFGLLALVLAGVGVYGVMRRMVAERTRQIGILMAVGAQRGHILRQILGYGLRLVVGGMMLGLVMSWAVNQVLESFLFDLTPTDPVTMATASIILLTVASLACFIPAFRASRLDPMDVLRTE